MLPFYKSDEIAFEERELSNIYVRQNARRVQLLPFTIKLNGVSSTIVSVHLIKYNGAGHEMRAFKIDNSSITYNSTYDILINTIQEFGEVSTGIYRIKIVTSDETYKSAKFNICDIDIPAKTLQDGGEDDVLKNYLTIEDGGENVGKYTIYATDFRVIEGVNFVDIDVDKSNYVYQTEYVDVKIMEGESIIGNERLIIITSTSMVSGEIKLVRNEIKVIGTLPEDIYLTYRKAFTDNEGGIDRVDITVKIIPLMKLLWMGMWLMILGMILRIISEKKLLKRRDLEKKKDKDVQKIKSGKYYEDLVEEELKKIKT